MIVVKLKHAMKVYRHKTGRRLTYEQLSKMTGISRATLESIATRRNYNPTLATIDKLCAALNVEPGELLELAVDPNPIPRITAFDQNLVTDEKEENGNQKDLHA